MQLNTFLCLLSFSCLVIVAQTASIEEASRILGGSYAAPRQFPYQVAVLLNHQQMCGGSIISENYVVTAAHCVSRQDEWTGMINLLPTEWFSIRAGSTSRSSGGMEIQISDAKIHDGFDFIPRHGNDIALLKLSEPLAFSDSIKAIKLARKAPPAGASITISGWGWTANSEPSEKLKYENMKAFPSNQRNLLVLGHSEGHGSWEGDSGGPAVYENKLVAVCSFGTTQNKKIRWDFYTMVPAYYEWLYSNSDLRN